MPENQSNQTVSCVVYGKTITSSTGDNTQRNNTQTMTIKSCTMDCGCYIRGHGIWCNHCCDVYQIVERIIELNPNLPFGACMSICMKQLRGKCSGVLCEKFIHLLTERRKINA